MCQKGGLVLLDPRIKEFTPQPIWDMLVSFDELNEARERANSKSTKPREFVFNNRTYVHIPGTENFSFPNPPLDEEGNPLEYFTPLQIMAANFEPTKSFRRRITPVESAKIMLWLGDSARFKIIRAVQLHDAIPPVTAATNQYTDFFKFLSEGVEDHWTVQQQYSSCKWATSQDEALATSMLLHYGWVPRYTERMKGCVIYQMRRATDGIHLIFSEPHTYQSRLDAGCLRAREIADAFKRKEKAPPFNLLFKEACRVFFSFNHFYISITAAYRQTALNKIRAYCEHLTNALRDYKDIAFPQLEQPLPDECIEVQYDEDNAPIEYILKWEDFIFEEGATIKQKNQRQTIANQKQIDALLKAWSTLDINGAYSFDELTKVMSKNTFTRSKADEYLICDHKIGRKTFWKLDLEKINNERN